MFFHLSINHYAPLLIRFWCRQKGGLCDGICYAFPAPPCCDVGVVKFCAGLVIGFGLGVYFLLILIAEKGRVRQRVASQHVCSEFAWVR